jgi:hypothetical protein
MEVDDQENYNIALCAEDYLRNSQESEIELKDTKKAHFSPTIPRKRQKQKSC